MSKTRNAIIEILENNGVNIKTNSTLNYLDHLDSLQFISFLCDVEDRWEIVVPDSLLERGRVETFDGFVADIENIIDENFNGKNNG
ncbi:MAG: hypothetical protein ACLKAK_10825 [Alkaliphilus sp.]